MTKPNTIRKQKGATSTNSHTRSLLSGAVKALANKASGQYLAILGPHPKRPISLAGIHVTENKLTKARAGDKEIVDQRKIQSLTKKR